jgi:transcription elongation factor GreA
MADRKLEELAAALRPMIAAQDFAGALKVIKDYKEILTTKPLVLGVRETLKKATKDRLLLSFVDVVGFGTRSLAESLARLEKLLALEKGAHVLNQAWGFGTVKGCDLFYRKITVDFTSHKGHQLSFNAACDTLELAPEDHILAIAAIGDGRVDAMIKDRPGEFVKEMLKSFGDMPVTRLETECAKHGFVKEANWKDFWNRAREALKSDKLVEIPTRRTEPIHLKASAESYGESWFTAFSQMKDPKSILSSVKELEGTERMKSLSEADREKISNRLEFALKGARGVDNALYAKIAFCVAALKLEAPSVSACRNYLWGDKRYLAAARELPARDAGTLVAFLTAEDRETTKKELFKALPEMCFPLLVETLTFFSNDADCADAVSALLGSANPPPTLVTCIVGRYDSFKGLKGLPSLTTILLHAIALGEGRQSGEALRMQNMVRRLFSDKAWLEDVFAQLDASGKVQVFERFQASTSWDPATHRTITVRMSKLDEATLAPHVVRKVEVKVAERTTSQRSYNEKKAAYDRLVNVDMPANTKRIEFARGYGDLSENAEYQYAKDEQRALLQKQSLMQKDLDEVKPSLFEGVETDEVRVGTMVAIATGEGEQTFVILGEWDNDPSLNIIASGTKLAMNLLGHRPGDDVEILGADGTAVPAKVVRIEPLPEAVKVWIKG